MIRFNREVIIDKHYKVSLKEFMSNYYSGAIIDSKDLRRVVMIYVKSVINSGNMSWVFDVPYIEGMDIEKDKDVEKMIRASQKADKKKKEGFTL